MKKLNKFISDSGYCSRREADRYIAEGRVTVNRVEATLGSVVEDGDLVEVDGERVGRAVKRRVYLAFNKPVGVTSTTDPNDKTNIVDFINHKERIFPVGRLDKDSEGLIILTNDGDIVNKILRAGNDNPKEYVVMVDKPVTSEFLSQMSRGVRILGTVTKPCKVTKHNETTFVIHLTQGLNRQIRRMCQTLGYKVKRLKRVKVMNISLGGLEPGAWRYFTQEETAEMYRLLADAVGTEDASTEGKRKTKSGSSFSQYRKQGRAGSEGVKARKASSGNAAGEGERSKGIQSPKAKPSGKSASGGRASGAKAGRGADAGEKTRGGKPMAKQQSRGAKAGAGGGKSIAAKRSSGSAKPQARRGGRK